MGNPNPSHRIRSSKEASEMGKKGGKAKLGYKSLKTILREIFESGEVDQKEFVKAQLLEAMDGNGALAKLLWEYHDGKVADKVEMTGKDGGPLETQQTIINIIPVKAKGK